MGFLPPELLHMIMDEVGGELHTILRCRLVNRTFAAVAIPFAFKTIVIKKTFIKERSGVTFEDLSTRLGITKYVKRIVYDAEGIVIPYVEQNQHIKEIRKNSTDKANKASCIATFAPGFDQDNELPKVKQVTEFIDVMVEEFNVFHRFKNLESLSILFPWFRWGYEGYYGYDDGPNSPFFSNVDTRLQVAILEALESVYVEHASPFHLKTFELRNVMPYPMEALTSEGLQSMLKQITSLSIAVYPRHPYPDDVKPEDNSKGSIYARFAHTIAALMRPLENLESLRYCDDLGADEAINERWEQWDTLYFPRLKCLRFERIAFDQGAFELGSGGEIVAYHAAGIVATDFLLRHKATLEEVHMEECYMRDTDIWKWEQVFDDIRDELENLTTFTFEPRPGPDKEGRLYNGYRYVAEFGFDYPETHMAENMNYDEEDVEGELEALRSLQEVVSERRIARFAG
ncbi:hypothetical protein CPC08DRAFT_715589 [Agrocybe pediades]|nr:hypothetical protein CPC08DRAFT_715589 [Agrocybe pediades]